MGEINQKIEYILERQIQAMERLDEKSALLIRLGVLSLIGGTGIVTLLIQAVPEVLDWDILVVLVLGAILNLVSIVFLLVSYLGGKGAESVATGPSVGWLKEKSSDEEWTWEDQIVSMADKAPEYVQLNFDTMNRSVNLRSMGLNTLLGAVLFYSGTMIYIVSRVIYA